MGRKYKLYWGQIMANDRTVKIYKESLLSCIVKIAWILSHYATTGDSFNVNPTIPLVSDKMLRSGKVSIGSSSSTF
jgi:hypothetical protein